ncbi:MAG: hypothetical protein ACRD3O_05935 [Terriglobia bacterium]
MRRPILFVVIVLTFLVYSGLIGLWPARIMLAQVNIRHQPLDPFEVQYYSRARSVISWSRAELIHAIPELKRLRPVASQAVLPAILQNVGNNVSEFLRDFPNTTSTEKVLQQVFDRAGRVSQSQFRTFHYLILARHGAGVEGLEEYRTDNRGNRITEQSLEGPFILTKGFATDAIFFDKACQPASRFRYLGQQVIHHQHTDVVAFAQNPTAEWEVEQARIGQESAEVLVQGVAWIDSQSYQIVRLRTELLAPPPGLDLEKQTTEIEFGPVRFKSAAEMLWLPRQVTVTVELSGRRYRNSSSYSKYELFKVNTKLDLHPQ